MSEAFRSPGDVEDRLGASLGGFGRLGDRQSPGGLAAGLLIPEDPDAYSSSMNWTLWIYSMEGYEHEDCHGADSHDVLGSTGRKTGFWLEEFAAPYFVFRDAGIELTLASPKGGQPPIDPKSDLTENQTAAMTRFKQDTRAQNELSQTVKLDAIKSRTTTQYSTSAGMVRCGTSLKAVFRLVCEVVLQLGQSDSVSLPLARRAAPRNLQRRACREGKARHGIRQWRGRAVQLTHVVPFLVEDELMRLGAIFEKVKTGNHTRSWMGVLSQAKIRRRRRSQPRSS